MSDSNSCSGRKEERKVPKEPQGKDHRYTYFYPSSPSNRITELIIAEKWSKCAFQRTYLRSNFISINCGFVDDNK